MSRPDLPPASLPPSNFLLLPGASLLANNYDKDTFFCKSVRGFGAQLAWILFGHRDLWDGEGKSAICQGIKELSCETESSKMIVAPFILNQQINGMDH